MTGMEKAVEAAAVLKIVDDICVLSAQPAADDYERAMHDVGTEITKRVTALPAAPQSHMGVQQTDVARETAKRLVPIFKDWDRVLVEAGAGDWTDSYELTDDERKILFELIDWAAALPAQSGSGVMRREDVAREPVSKDAVLDAMRCCWGNQEVRDALTTTKWKDGIDIQEPSHSLMMFVSLVLALPQSGHTGHTGQPVEGWQLVPVEPTEEMIDRGGLARDNSGADENTMATWKAMLSASPAAPQKREGEK